MDRIIQHKLCLLMNPHAADRGGGVKGFHLCRAALLDYVYK